MLVLFSVIDQSWKIADFGATKTGSSTTLMATSRRYGTTSFRAPELMNEDEGKYSSRTDIWAFGCLTYEICTNEKAFLSDWATLRYANTENRRPKTILDFPEKSPSANVIEVARDQNCGDKCLNVAWQHRISASELLMLMNGWQGKLTNSD